MINIHTCFFWLAIMYDNVKGIGESVNERSGRTISLMVEGCQVQSSFDKIGVK